MRPALSSRCRRVARRAKGDSVGALAEVLWWLCRACQRLNSTAVEVCWEVLLWVLFVVLLPPVAAVTEAPPTELERTSHTSQISVNCWACATSRSTFTAVSSPIRRKMSENNAVELCATRTAAARGVERCISCKIEVMLVLRVLAEVVSKVGEAARARVE